MRKELLIGCGNRRRKMLHSKGHTEWEGLVTLDIDPNCGADIVHDLTVLPYPFENDELDEIHAYDVLEHTGQQGDWRFFFAQFNEFWRILKPGGVLYAKTPSWRSVWAWGDPGHSRVIQTNSLVFLNQPEYTRQVGVMAMTDYRSLYKADFDVIHADENENDCLFAIKAVKPSRITV